MGVKIRVTLQLMVGRSVCLGIEPLWEINNNMDLRETGCECVDWIQLAHRW